MNKPQIFEHSIFGAVQVIQVDGKEMFGAAQVALSLGYANPHKAVRDHCREDGCTIRSVTDSLGRSQEMKFIDEGNLYRLIVRSKLPAAELFERWVFDEVIPSIRKHGAYMSPETIERTLTNPDFIIQLATQLKDEQTARLSAEAKIAEQQQKLKEQETPIAIYNLAISAKNTMSMNEVAKALGTGRTRLFRILREENVIMKDKAIPYQRFIDAGYFTVCERPRPSGDEVVNDSVTRVYAKGFDYIARLLKKRAEREADGLGKNA